MNRHNTCLDWDEDAVKFSASLSTDTDVVSSSMKIELPPPFKGDGTKSFATWSKQFEAAVRAHTRVGAGARYSATLSTLLPTRLDGAAFILWDSLPSDVQSDYLTVKERLLDAFGQKQFILYFQTCLNARPRHPNESLEVFAAEISRLVLEAFPEYDKTAQDGEKFRRFLAGLDPALQTKCHEMGATDLEEAMAIAARCERARQALLNTRSPPMALQHTVSALDSVGSNAGLLSAVERLSMKVDKLQTELRDIKDNNCKAGYDRQDMYSSRWRDQRSPSPYRGRRGGCRCDCGEYGCRSAAPDFSVRGRSPRRGGSFQVQERSDARTPTAGPWSPRDTEGPYKRGVRFLSPGRRSPSPAQARRDQENSQ